MLRRRLDAVGGWVQELAQYLETWSTLVGVHGFISVDMPYLLPTSDFPFAHLHFLADAWQALCCRPLVDGPTLLCAAARSGLLLRPRTASRFSRFPPPPSLLRHMRGPEHHPFLSVVVLALSRAWPASVS